jgi:hypothetical protein
MASPIKLVILLSLLTMSSVNLNKKGLEQN